LEKLFASLRKRLASVRKSLHKPSWLHRPKGSILCAIGLHRKITKNYFSAEPSPSGTMEKIYESKGKICSRCLREFVNEISVYEIPLPLKQDATWMEVVNNAKKSGGK
jgi:hypothetical protein